MKTPLFDLLNDYRDSLCYGIGLLIMAVLDFNSTFNIAYLTHFSVEYIFMLMWLRELCRMAAWTYAIISGEPDSKKFVYASISCFVFLSSIVCDPLAYENYKSWWFPIIMTINIISFIKYYRVCGGVRATARIYWKDLFDWPRKQKPPAHRWDTVKNKAKSFVEKFQPDFVPSPAGCRVIE